MGTFTIGMIKAELGDIGMGVWVAYEVECVIAYT